MKIAQIPKRKKFDNVVLIILIIGLPILVFATYKVVQVIINASADTQPKNVVVSDLTTNSITISWVTDSPVTGAVAVYQNGSQKIQVADSRGSSRKLTHYVEISGLEPDSSYDFTIISGSDKYISEGSKKFVFDTAPITPQQVTPNSIYGQVTMGSGDQAIIYAVLSDKSAYPASAIVKSDGTWLIDLASLRKISDKSLVTISDTSSIAVVVVAGVNRGAVVEGAYSTLFNSDGNLMSSNSLTITDRSDMYSYIPDGAKLIAYDETPEPEEEKPVEEEPVVEEPVVEEPTPPVEVEFKRVYRIVHQLPWIDLAVEGSETSPVTASITGENSIKVTNLTDTGFTVVWLSKQKEKGYVNYGTSKSNLNNTANDSRDGLITQGEYYVHNVDISKLQPETAYYYEIKSGTNTYDNDGIKYTINTFATQSSPPAFESIKGKYSNLPSHGEAVLMASIQDADDTGTSGRSFPISTVIGDGGLFTLTISNSWSADGSSYFEYTSSDKISLDIITTLDIDTQTTTIKDVLDNDIDVDINDIAESPITTTKGKVPKLSNYGIVGATDGTSLSTSSYTSSTTSGTSMNISTNSSSTPKTGATENTIFALCTSGAFIIFGSIIYFRTGKKKKIKSKMADNL